MKGTLPWSVFTVHDANTAKLNNNIAWNNNVVWNIACKVMS